MRPRSLVPLTLLPALASVLVALRNESGSLALHVLTDVVFFAAIVVGVVIAAPGIRPRPRTGTRDGDADRLNELEPVR